MSQTLGCVRHDPKSNDGRYIDRFPQIQSAGYRNYTAAKMDDIMQKYDLQDEVDALVSKVVVKEPLPKPVYPCSQPKDARHTGYFGEIKHVLAPPIQTKFQTLVQDLKETVYSSYWKKPLGHGPDRASMLPNGFDYNKPLGRKTPKRESENLIFPDIPDPVHERFRLNHDCNIQKRYGYCEPPFNPNIVFGHKTKQDPMGTGVKCCLTYSNSLAVPMNTIAANYKDNFGPKLGMALTPNDNIPTADEGFTFGDQDYDAEDTVVITRITLDNVRKEKRFLTKCLRHINSVRRSLFKLHRALFFKNFYLNLKYLDKSMSGWLEKEIVYDKCLFNHLRFDPTLVEPLLQLWKFIDGSKIQYQGFCNLLDQTVPLPDLPKIMDVDESCLDYTTTYMEMVKPNQEVDSRPQAGKPSGMYFVKDYPVTPKKCCAAHRAYLPEESSVSTNLTPSIFSLFGVTHREMFATRDRKTVRRVFEAVEEFTDELFDAVWNEATKYHSKGLVCYETFRKALKTFKDANAVQEEEFLF